MIFPCVKSANTKIHKYTNTQTHKHTNTAYDKVPEKPTILDHGDGKFLGTMECQWFSSRYHCGQWFFNGFFTSEPSLSMVFHISTIGINGFSNGFSISDDGFSMVFYR